MKLLVATGNVFSGNFCLRYRDGPQSVDVAFVFGLDNMRAALILDIAVEQQRWVLRICVILRIQAEISNGVVDITIAVDVGSRNAVPPASEFSDSGRSRDIGARSFDVAIGFYWAPLMGHQQVDPAVAIRI